MSCLKKYPFTFCNHRPENRDSLVANYHHRLHRLHWDELIYYNIHWVKPTDVLLHRYKHRWVKAWAQADIFLAWSALLIPAHCRHCRPVLLPTTEPGIIIIPTCLCSSQLVRNALDETQTRPEDWPHHWYMAQVMNSAGLSPNILHHWSANKRANSLPSLTKKAIKWMSLVK